MVFGESVSLVAVLIAAIASMIIGWLWYGPIFGKLWMKLMGMSKNSIKGMKMTPTMSMALMFIGSLITAYILGAVIGLANANSVTEGAMVGFWVWLGFAMPLHAGVFLWEGKPMNLFWLNTFQYLISILIMGAILAVW